MMMTIHTMMLKMHPLLDNTYLPSIHQGQTRGHPS